MDAGLQYGWRCRAKLAVRGSSMDPLIGLYEEGTHNIVDIPECKGLTSLLKLLTIFFSFKKRILANVKLVQQNLVSFIKNKFSLQKREKEEFILAKVRLL